MTDPAGKYTDIHSDLIQKCLKNDKRAQTEIYRLYYKAVFNTSMRILKDVLLAEDVMQETFITAFTRLGTYNGEASFGSWLKRIAINKSIDELRKKSDLLEPLEMVPERQFLPDSDEYNPEYEKEVSLTIEMVKKAINLLPDGYRVVLTLYLLEGYDHEEIGSILNINESTSRSQFTRAKQKLLEILNHEQKK